MQVVPDGRPCECGNHGCWEQYASGRVLTALGRAAARAGTALGRGCSSRAAATVTASTGRTSPRRRAAGDEVAASWLAEVGDWLGVGLANLAAALDPGRLRHRRRASARPASCCSDRPGSAFSRTLTGRGYRPEARIVAADLGPEAGLVGAADLADSPPGRS